LLTISVPPNNYFSNSLFSFVTKPEEGNQDENRLEPEDRDEENRVVETH